MGCLGCHFFFFFSSRRRHTRYIGDWSSDVCSSDLAVRAWFAGRFPAGPTEPQAAGWREIAAARHTLIAAPTGSGKTLAAFLVCIDRFYRAHDSSCDHDLFCGHEAGPPPDGPAGAGPQVVYVSPLK